MDTLTDTKSSPTTTTYTMTEGSTANAVTAATLADPALNVPTNLFRSTNVHHHPTLMIKFCLDKATQCRCGAEQAIEPASRRSWLELEGRWFFLARSYDNERRAAMSDIRGDRRAYGQVCH